MLHAEIKGIKVSADTPKELAEFIRLFGSDQAVSVRRVDRSADAARTHGMASGFLEMLKNSERPMKSSELLSQFGITGPIPVSKAIEKIRSEIGAVLNGTGIEIDDVARQKRFEGTKAWIKGNAIDSAIGLLSQPAIVGFDGTV